MNHTPHDALILHHNPLEPFPYDRWLADHPGEVVVLAARDVIERAKEQVPQGRMGTLRFETLPTFLGSDEIVLDRARELIRAHGLQRVITHYEDDMERAAILRAEFDMPGGHPDDVAPFRDKPLMKQRLMTAGIEVAKHVVPQSLGEALAFADLHGMPIVAKIRNGGGSEEQLIARSRHQLKAHLVASRDKIAARRILLEAFVPGKMCHVDGMVAGGRTVLAWPSQYQYDLASFGADKGARIDLTLDPDDPLTPRLLELTERALAALRPADSRMTEHGFHAEIFHTPDDRLVVCEIAARPSGAKNRNVFHTMFGINHAEYTTRAMLGLPLPLLADTLAGGPLPVPQCMSGQVLMMKRPGLVRAVPERPTDDWVAHFWCYAEPGDFAPAAGFSADFLLAAVGRGPNRVEVERRLRELGDRFVAQVDIVDGATQDRVDEIQQERKAS